MMSREPLPKPQSQGGRVITPKTHLPGVGWWGMFADPDGIPIGTLEEE
jgi:predicted enzyme related to lactoylglutathione lyase